MALRERPSISHFCLLLALFAAALTADPARIRLNQLGFYTDGPKTAIAVAPETWYFSIRSPDLKTTYHSGELSAQSVWSASGEKVKCADFSSFNRPGDYVVFVAGIGASYTFTIAENNLKEVTRGLIKAFYYQRASTALPVAYAGNWSRPAGHGDTRISVHASAASDPSKPDARKAGDVHSSPKGWYDAGDYGKYVVNAGITTYELLLLYECFPGYFDRFGLNIPESNGHMPDILDEIKWELDWLLTMQDDADGGVYHKLTSPTFCGDVMPAKDRDARFFIGKGSAATFDFAAILATSYRIYKKYLPSFADSCLSAARYAWQWGTEHPDSSFINPTGVVTGEYGDRTLVDEKQWAAFELFIATGDSSYYRAGRELTPGYGVPDWQKVAMLGCYSMALCKGDSPAREKIIAAAATLLKRTQTTPYRTSIVSEFGWGSNGVVANQGICMIVAYLLTGSIDYMVGAVNACDYLLGRNAVGYSFITGFGTRSPQHPHHRPSTADGISAPIPGLLSGGPNAQAGGESCTEQYPASRAQKWLDQACSYTTNEIAVNWNSAAAFLTGAIDALMSERTTVRQDLHAHFRADTTAPSSLTLAITNVRCDRATVGWKTDEAAAVTLFCSPATYPGDIRRIVCGRSDSASVKIHGLLPETVYNVGCIAIDQAGNATTIADSFRTEAGAIRLTPLPRSAASPGNYNTVAVTTAGIGDTGVVHLTYTIAGSVSEKIVGFGGTGDIRTAAIPDSAPFGFTCFASAIVGTDTIISPPWSVTPDTLSSADITLLPPGAYRMVSFPGLYAPKPASLLFTDALDDTVDWRLTGFDAATKTGIPFDSLRCGRGSWLFLAKSRSFSWKTSGIPPDTLFPIMLRGGWNLIGNPFPFPVVWDNILIAHGDARIPISDPAATRFVRRQFFYYADTLFDNVNNGHYHSNRKLDSHLYDTTARLHPFEALWIYAERDSATIELNPVAKPLTPAVLGKEQQRAETRSWFLSINLRSNNRGEGPVVLGASASALESYDEFDSPSPPAVSKGLSAAFLHPEWQRAVSTFASDIIHLNDDGADRWKLRIAFDGKHPVTLTWQPSGRVGGYLSYSDPVAGISGSIEKNGEYTFSPSSGESYREIAFIRTSEKPALQSAALPAAWSFSMVPAAKGYVFGYHVPSTSDGTCDVSITIHDIRGRLVCTLRSGTHGAGSYQAVWSHATMRTAARGMYIARLHSAAFSKSIGFNIVK